MSCATTKPAGMFSWNELMTTDVAGAKAFYGKLFGWQMEDIHPGNMTYTMAKSGDQEVAGIMGLTEESKGMPPSWGGYVTVRDVDAMLPQVENLGGKICIPAQDIPEVGRFAVIQDPQGAMLSLITYQD